ncbi:MFS transporter [Skermania sp. ID1734]|nr:MFS transporter [Skermania sp. ID1734]
MGLGNSITSGDPTILSANISAVREGVGLSGAGASFLASLATLALAAAVLGAGALGDIHGKRRLFIIGLFAAIAFDVLAAAAPNAAVLFVARAGVGVGFALLLGLSLAIVNDAFPPKARPRTIAVYLGTAFAATAPQPAIGSLLVEHFGWRTGFLVGPAVAVMTLLITWRYVPESERAHRSLDTPGMGLIAIGLLGVVFGISRLESGSLVSSAGPIVVGLLGILGFCLRELHTANPALDLRIFRSAPFNAAVLAGATFNFLTGGSTILFAFYIVTIQHGSPALLGFLLIPATLLQAVAGTAAGPAATRFGERSVLVSGLAVLLAGLILMVALTETSPVPVLFTAVALNAIGGAIVQTPQSTIMMASAPEGLGGAVSAVKSGVGQAAYSLGPALFALVGTTVFLHNGEAKLSRAGISVDQARDALRVAHGGTPPSPGGPNVLDPDRARAVVQGATHSMVTAIHFTAVVMAIVPVVAIVLALFLLDGRPSGAHTDPEVQVRTQKVGTPDG